MTDKRNDAAREARFALACFVCERAIHTFDKAVFELAGARHAHCDSKLARPDHTPKAIPHSLALELLEVAEDVLASATEWTPKDLLAKATRAVRKAKGEEEER